MATARRGACRSLAFCAAPLLFVLAAIAAPCSGRADDPLGRSPTGTIPGHPALVRSPRHTTTARGHQGDAVNVALIGTEDDLHRTLAAAGWYAADPITLETSIRIAADCVLRKPYPHAPVSDLYLWGRTQDAAFKQPVGNSPAQRHHVRFWRSRELDERGRPLWLGAATFDERVEISRTTGGVTHKIGPDIDRERNKILADTLAARMLDGYYWVDQFHVQAEGRNGGGDAYHTDRRLAVGVIDLRR
ncbi:MAG: LssY C-terminal domain-containing protein [Planctomycetia bacterium]